MSADFWRRNVFDLAEFGDELQLTLPRTSTFTFSLYFTLTDTKKKKKEEEEPDSPAIFSDSEV